MEIVTLEVVKRENSGSRYARNLRRAGSIPAIVYGRGMTPLSLEVDQRRLGKALKTKAGENVLINLQVPGVKLDESTCLIRSIQHNPITDEIQHVDFNVISLKEKIEVEVHVLILHADEALGVREGGIVDVVHHSIPIECLPADIPEHIEVDVKNMKINDAIHAQDLKLPAGIVCTLPPTEVVVALQPPRKDEDLTAPPTEEATQPEVIEKGKKEEAAEGAEGAAPAKGGAAPKQAAAPKAGGAAPKK